jgi:hypothetical protein
MNIPASVLHTPDAFPGSPAASPHVMGNDGLLPGVKVTTSSVSFVAPWCGQLGPKAALRGFSRSPPCVARPQVEGVLKIMWALAAGARRESRRAAGNMGECMVWMVVGVPNEWVEMIGKTESG